MLMGDSIAMALCQHHKAVSTSASLWRLGLTRPGQLLEHGPPTSAVCAYHLAVISYRWMTGEVRMSKVTTELRVLYD